MTIPGEVFAAWWSMMVNAWPGYVAGVKFLYEPFGIWMGALVSVFLIVMWPVLVICAWVKVLYIAANNLGMLNANTVILSSIAFLVALYQATKYLGSVGDAVDEFTELPGFARWHTVLTVICLAGLAKASYDVTVAVQRYHRRNVRR